MVDISYDIADDSGALAIIDPDAYDSFVDQEWEVELLDEHFKAQMRARHLLIWETGMENVWQVQVCQGQTSRHGFREVTGPVIATRGRLLLTSYNSLTMAAQFPDVRLPQPHERDQVLAMSPGEYHCRVVQLHNPDPLTEPAVGGADGDFIVEIFQADGQLPPWDKPAWGSHVFQ